MKLLETSEFIVEDLGIQEIDVYDIEVDGNHNFFANDILVHNSVYVDMSLLVKKHCDGKTKQEIVTFIESFVKNVLTPSINKELAKISSTLNIDDCKIDFKLENIGPSLIMVAKKRYLFDILYSEGVRYDTEQMKVMGIEIVRSSTPSAVQDYLRELVAICLRSDERALHTRFKEIKELFMKCSLSDIAYPRGVNGMDTYANDTSIYSKGTPIHVRGALLYNHHLRRNSLDKVYESISDGDKIKFIALKKPNPIYENVISYLDKLPTEFGLHNYVDYDMQFEKALVAPLVNILEPMNWHYEERITLDDFFT
jgi:DNA polymerase elongation subunit (family B)